MMKIEVVIIVLYLCHTLADYTHLSTAWMLNAKKVGTPIGPIAVHAAVHATLMGISLAILWYSNFINFDFDVAGASILVQFASHLAIDVGKGTANRYFPKLLNPANKWHWVLFGTDQFLHLVVIVAMASLITY